MVVTACGFISSVQFVVVVVAVFLFSFRFTLSSSLLISEARTVIRSDLVPQIAFACTKQDNIRL